ncbi:MAG: hypothetical protein J5515_01690, partial [Lachnospiraceae bacterium]|nr:hypothetical protein [Lachnospiraceae bacterium]
MRTILNSLRIILSIRNTISVNEIIHGIRSIPIIGKYIPETIYDVKIIKIIALILSVSGEILKAFFLKLALFVVLFFASGVVSSYDDFSQKGVFLYGFLYVSLAGAFVYNVFKNTPEADYAVFHLGMDAKKFVTARFFYDSFNVVLGYAVFGIPLALLSRVDWYLALLLPLAGVGFKAVPLGIEMSVYAAKQARGKKKNRKGVPVSVEGNVIVNSLVMSFVIVAGLILGGWLTYKGLFMPVTIIYVLTALAVFPGILLMKKFPFGLYKTALYAEKTRSELVKEDAKKQRNGNVKVVINEAEGSRSKAKGYRYLNELFMKRHQKIFWKREIIAIISVLGTIALMSLFFRFEMSELDDGTESIVRFLFSKHPGLFIFALFILNTGAYMSHAMFASCDSSMLVYGFYRTPDALRKMFRLRVMSVTKFNLIPAVLMAVFCIVTLAVSGGERFFGEYLFTTLTLIVFTAYFSIRNVTIFYLLQPYASDFAIKSKLFL